MEPDWQPELRTLRCFVCVAEEKSLTRAATRLRIAQPALSRRIQNLEADLGVILFTRTARGVEITGAGEILLRRAYVILNQIQQAHHDVTAHGDTPRGTVTVGMPPTPGEFIAPPLLDRIKQDFPDVQLHIVEGFSSELERKLTNNEISLAVMHDPPKRDDLRTSQMLDEKLYLVGPTGGVAQESYTLAEAAALPLILPSRPNFLRILIDTHAQQKGVSLNIVQKSDGVWLLKALVRAGHGYTILTYGAALTEIERETLAAAPIRDPEISWTLCTAARRESGQKPAQAVVEEAIHAIVGDLVSRGVWR